jgi:hypothetical protein
MRLLSRGLTLASAMLLAASVARAEVREWSDATGKYKIQAEFVELAGDVVKLKNAAGKVLSIPLAKLSKADRDFIASLAAPPVVEGPLPSLVRVYVPIAAAEGEPQEVMLVGFAIQTADAGGVIITSRRGVPRDVDAAAFEQGLGQAEILALREDTKLGMTAAAGVYPGVGFGGDGGVYNPAAGRDGETDFGRDDGGFAPPGPAGPAGPPQANAAADAAAAEVLVLRTAPETRIPPLVLAFAPAAAGDAVSIAKLQKPRVRPPGAPLPPIPWTSWTVLGGPQMDVSFNLRPQDGQFPFAGPLPVINARQEVVGMIHVGAKTLPDKTRAATAVGLGALRAALAKASVPMPPPPPPPQLPSTDALANSPLVGVFTRLNPFGGSSARPTAAGPAAGWHGNYDELVAAITPQSAGESGWQIEWGAAADFGGWYDEARQAAAARQQFDNSGGRDMQLEQTAQQHEQLAAAALTRLQPVEWVADVIAPSTNPDIPCQLNLTPPPAPLRFNFVVDPADTRAWGAVAAGDRVRFGVQFGVTERQDYPAVNVIMTLREVVRAAPSGNVDG